MILSILTPAVPSRLEQLATLCAEISGQIRGLDVEHLVFLDNKRRTVGEKRDALLRIAKGDYVAFLDDDDKVTYNYVSSLVSAASSSPDVITFNQHCIVDGVEFEVHFGLGYPNEPASPGKAIKRNAWHVCAWRRTLAMLSHFPASNYGEDWAYASKLCALPGLKETHIPKVLHRYRHSASKTEAPPPS